MEALRSRTNISTLGAKHLQPLTRKPLRRVQNKATALPAKSTLRGKERTTDKENVSQVPKGLKGKEVKVSETKEVKEVLRRRTNISTFGAKNLQPLIRKPLRRVQNKATALPAKKGTLREKERTTDKENVSQVPKGLKGKEVKVIETKEVKGSLRGEERTTDKENVSQVPKGLKEKEVKVFETKEVKVLDTTTPQLLQSLPRIEESHSSQQLPDDVENIDAYNSSNPQLVSKYVNSIYSYLRKLEMLFPIKKLHLQLQPEINGKMRAILVDWLVKIHHHFHLLQETLYMTISILDRYLQVDNVKKSELQLVGITSMFIASKFEETYAPEVRDFVYMTDNSYSKQDVFKMERKILCKLEFNLSKPLPPHFLRRNSNAGNADSTVYTLAKYLMEVCLPEYDMAHIKPSLLAAAALYLSLKLLTESPWNDTLKYYSNYSEEQLIPVVKSICKVIVTAELSKTQAIHQKYASKDLGKISTIPQLKSSIVKKLAGAEE